MSRQRGPLLLILLLLITVIGSYASPLLYKSAMHHNDLPFYRSYAIHGLVYEDDWLGGTGSWSDPSCWDYGIPSSGSYVVIDSGGSDLVLLDINATINSLTLGGTTGSSELDNYSSLVITGALTVNQTGTLFNELNALQVQGDVNNTGKIVTWASNFNLGGTLSNGTTGQINFGGGDSVFSVQGDVYNAGEIFDLPFPPKLTNGPIPAAGFDEWNIGGTFHNSGSFLLTYFDSVTAGNLVNSGRIDFGDAPQVRIGGDVLNSGSISATGYQGNGLLNIGGTLNNSGGLSLSGHQSVNIGSISNSGGIDLWGTGYLGDATLATGDVSNSGSISAGNASILSIGSLNNSGGFLLGGNNDQAYIDSIINSGVIDVENSSGLQTNSIDNSGRIITSNASGLSIGTLNNSGLLALGGYGDQASIGGIINRGRIDVAFSSSLQTGGIDNFGLITTGAGGNLLSIGALTNESGGSILLNGASDTANVDTITNAGAIDIESGSTFQVSGETDNSGTISTTAYGGSGSNTISIGGTLTNGTTGSFVLYGAGDTATIASVVNKGFVDLENGSSLQVSNNVTNSGVMTTSYHSGGGNTTNIAGKFSNDPSGLFSLQGQGDLASVGSFINRGTVAIAAGANLNVTGAGSGVTAAGFINNGFVNISQGGTLSSRSYSQTLGQTTVDGTLSVSGNGLINFAGGAVYGNQGTISGNVASNTSINLGDSLRTVGEMFFNGNYTQGPKGKLTFDIAGVAPGEFDQLNINGHAQLNGMLSIDLLQSFVPQIGDSFDIMNFGNFSGKFFLALGLPINGTEHFVLEYNPTDLTLEVVAGAMLGPNSNGTAPFAPVPSFAELNDGGSMVSNGATTLIADNRAAGSIFANGTTDAPSGGQSAPTPEPSSLLLLGSGLLCVGYGVRRGTTK